MATKKYLWETEVKNEPTKTTDKKYIWETAEEETPISTTSTAKTNKTQGGTGGGRMAVAGQSKETTGKESIFGTAGSIATSAGKGFLKAAEGISDVLQYGIAGAAQLVGAKKTRDWFIDAAKMNTTEQLTKTAEEYYNPIAAQGFKKDQIGSQISEGVGGVAANIGMAGLGAGATSKVGQIAGQYAPIFAGSTGSGISEGLNAGQSVGKSVAYGIGKGAIEAGSEAAFGGIGGAFGKGALDDLVVDATTKGIKNQVAKKLATLGVKAVGEGLEENISGALTPILQQMTIDPNATSYFKDENGKFTLKKAGQDFLIGALTSAIAQTPSMLTAPTSEITTPTQTNTQDNINIPTAQQTTQEVAKTTPQVDNTGKQVPNEIATELKDSKIRDKQGNLLEVYHGTTANFDVFDKKYIGASNDKGWFGAGFYFTDNENMAKDFYGKNGTYKKAYLDIKNPYKATADIIKDDGTVDFAPSFKDDFKNRFPETKNIDNITSQQITDILQKNGYDGIRHGDEIVAFEPEQIKQVGKQPTSQQTTQEVAKTTPQKQVGKTIKLYHGSNEMIDKLSTIKTKTSGRYGRGIYFTPNINDAKKYGDKINEREVYFNNPLVIDETILTEQQIKDAFNIIPEKYYFGKNSKDNTIKNILDEKDNTTRNIKFIKELNSAVDPLEDGVYADVYKKIGFDGIIDNKLNEYIVLDDTKTRPQSQQTNLPSMIEQEKTSVPQDTTQETKQRGVYSTALENQNIPADIKSGIKNLDKNYIVITDEDALGKAKDRITNNGYNKSLNYFETKVNNNEKLSKYDIAEATLLYNDAFAKGDTKKALDILTSIAVAGTESGQVSQATSILQKSTPDGRLLGLQKQVNKINKDNENKKSFQPITIKEEDINNIKNSQNQKELDEAVDKAMNNISEQMPKTLAYRLNEWRYFSMLANPKTHLRNMLSNFAMKGTSKIKNALSATIQDIIIKDPTQKTRTLKFADKKTRDFVRQDVIDQKNRIMGENKYESSKNQIKPKQSKGSAFNSKLLKDEDWLSSSGAYKSALANYITAQKIDVDNITPIELEKARQYAIDQAEEQTFRQTSALAESISKFGRGDKISNKLIKVATDAILPFKTTPINIAKTGLEYSPVGLIKTITKNTVELKSGKITPSKYIDNLSKGLTGSGIAAIGYLLADMGILTASGSDEDKEKYFQEMQGKQPYSIQIGDKTITLDWLSPSAMPFFMGAEISEMQKDGVDTNKLVNIASALGTIIDPLTELSMLQGLNKTLASYDKNKLGGVVTNTLQNYALQYIPTLSGQVARTLTNERKSTTGAGTGIEKQFNTFVNQVKAKVPGLINTLEPYTDQFGNKEVTGIAERAIQNFLSPAYVKTVKTDKVYDEIQKLYDSTGEKSVIPTSSSRYFTKDGEKIYLTPEEYTKFNTIDGNTSFKKIAEFIRSYRYNNLTDQQKVDEIEKFYKASQKIAKETYKKGK